MGILDSVSSDLISGLNIWCVDRSHPVDLFRNDCFCSQLQVQSKVVLSGASIVWLIKKLLDADAAGLLYDSHDFPRQ